jgi:protein transport protein SEC31
VPTPEIEDLYTTYSKALAEQGLLVTAAKYCRGSSTASRELRDRLYRSRASQRCYAVLGSAPEFPYAMVDIQQSRGQIMAQPIEAQVTTTTNGQEYNHQQAAYAQPEPQAYAQQEQFASSQQGYQTQNAPGTSDALPPGWVAVLDPSSGNTYYAHQTTGETTWDRPSAPAPVASYLAPQAATPDAGLDASQRSRYTNQAVDSKPQRPSLVSKYGDGFVTSASNPELAHQYGNVGTSNPYGGIARPGTAAAAVPTPQRTPVSGSLNFDALQLSNHHHSIKNTLLGVTSALDGTNLNPVEKRQLSEAEKGVAILVKKLAMDALSEEIIQQVFSLVSAVSMRDFGTALTVQTVLANSEWKEHKDWLKGIKILIQIASKKL